MELIERDQGAAEGAGERIFASIVLPVYRECEHIAGTLKRLKNYLRTVAWRAEVIVADDGSDDGTDHYASNWHDDFDHLVVARHASRKGRGAAARTGMLIAKGEYIILVDPRLDTPLEDITNLLMHLKDGADVALASRRVAGTEKARPFLQKAAQSTFFTLSQLMVPVAVRDSLCGLKGFRRRVGQKIARHSHVVGEAFGLEWLALAEWFGFQIAEFPVSMARRGASRRPPTAGGLGMLRDVWKTKRRLEGKGYAGPLPRQFLLHETTFVKFDRQKLLAERVPVRR